MIKCPDCNGEGCDWSEDPYCLVRDYCIHGGRCNRKPNECSRCEGTGETHPSCLFCGEPNTTKDAKEGDDCEACTNAVKCFSCGDPLTGDDNVQRDGVLICKTCDNRRKEGYCQQCQTKVVAAGNSHARPEHDLSCGGECRNCPIPVECGPVVYGGCEMCGDPEAPNGICNTCYTNEVAD